MRMVVSEMAGRASVELKGKELGFDLTDQGELLGRVAERVKNAEAQGYTYDAADASFELLLRDEMGDAPHFWETEGWSVLVQTTPGDPTDAGAEATVRLQRGRQAGHRERRGERARERARPRASVRRSQARTPRSRGSTSPTSRCASSMPPTGPTR